MEWIQVFTIILTILIPMGAGFGWMINQLIEMKKEIGLDLRKLDTRMSRIERYIEGKYDKIIGEE